MSQKAFRSGVLALLLALLLVPALRAAPRSPHPVVPRGILDRAWELMAGLFGGVGSLPEPRGLSHLLGANRGGIDPNGVPTEAPPDGCTSCSSDGTSPDPND